MRHKDLIGYNTTDGGYYVVTYILTYDNTNNLSVCGKILKRIQLDKGWIPCIIA